MAKPWGLLSRFLLFSVAFALGIASNFLLRSLPTSATTTTTVIQLADTVLSSPPPPAPPPSLPPPPPPRTPASTKRVDQQRGNEEEGGGGVVMLHNMTDDELLLRASMTMASPRIKGISTLLALGAPKVAFMFLVRGELPLAPLWERFFEGHGGMYSVYVHPDPSYAGSPEKGSLFYGRRVPSKEARWGKSSIAEAERRLLANALLDVGNQRFVLLSESCIPLFNFTTVHSYLTHYSTTSFVELFDAPGFHVRGRYRPAMAPTVTPPHWRKGSQWFAADRGLALEVVADETYFPVFQQHCSPPCVMDEHYLPTFIAASSGRCSGNANRTLTYARWTPGSPHPESYGKDLVTAELLEGIRTDRNCTDGCLSNGDICYLFARKFLRGALLELLRLAPKIMGLRLTAANATCFSFQDFFKKI